MTREATEEWNAVRDELLAMADEDLRVREGLAASGELFAGYHPALQAVHDANAARLAAILDALGWPGEPKVGARAAEAAWLIVQHAIAQPAFQRRALEFLRTAVDLGEAPGVQLAMLEDRIRTLEGRPQRYGTQFDWDAAGELSPLPVDDPERLDERRRAVGLGPLEEAVVAQRRAAQAEGERPPDDWRARQRAMEEWLRTVGWRR